MTRYSYISNFICSNSVAVSECIDSLLSSCDDSYKAIARWDILMYQSVFLGDQCNITSDALMAVPQTPLVTCMDILEEKAYNSSDIVCDSIGDFMECVRYDDSI